VVEALQRRRAARAGRQKPFSANNADHRPLRAALPTLTLFAGVPKHSHRPEELRGRGASAQTIWRSSARPACRCGGGAEYAAGRSDVPAPGIMGRARSPVQCGLHLIAEDEGEQQIGPAHRPQFGERQQGRRHRRVGWITVRRWVSQKSWTLALAALRNAALSASMRSVRPTTVACLPRRIQRASAMRFSTGPVRQPASATAKKFMNERLA